MGRRIKLDSSSPATEKVFGARLPDGRGSLSTCKHAVSIMSRAPAAHPETTGSRALENIDSKNTGRVAREQAVLKFFRTVKSACGSVLLILGLSMLLSGAVILDRIAVIAGTHVIKTRDMERDIPLTDFLKRAPLDLKTSAKREAAERLITQEIIRDEIVSGGYRRPPEAEAGDLEAQLRRDRFGGSEPRLVEGLQHYGLTRAELRGQLLWQITVLQFIDERFRGGVVVTVDEVRDFYDGHYVELRQQYPQD